MTLSKKEPTESFWNVWTQVANEPIRKINERPMSYRQAQDEVARLLNGKPKAMRAYATRVRLQWH